MLPVHGRVPNRCAVGSIADRRVCIDAHHAPLPADEEAELLNGNATLLAKFAAHGVCAKEEASWRVGGLGMRVPVRGDQICQPWYLRERSGSKSDRGGKWQTERGMVVGEVASWLVSF